MAGAEVIADAKPRIGAFTLVIAEYRGRKMLLVCSRSYRSKWWTLVCFCKRPRRDGTCHFLDAALAQVRPEIKPRVRIEHRP